MAVLGEIQRITFVLCFLNALAVIDYINFNRK